MKLEFEGGATVETTRGTDGVVTLECRGPLDRSHMAIVVAMWRVMHPAGAASCILARMEQATWLDETSHDFSPFGGVRRDQLRPPIAIVVAPEAHETKRWFLN